MRAFPLRKARDQLMSRTRHCALRPAPLSQRPRTRPSADVQHSRRLCRHVACTRFPRRIRGPRALPCLPFLHWHALPLCAGVMAWNVQMVDKLAALDVGDTSWGLFCLEHRIQCDAPS